MTSVFITRPLLPDSPFRRLLEAAGCRVSGRSLIRFTGRSFGPLPAVDWVFFYSKKAVRYFFLGLEERREQLPAPVRIAALGPGTGEALRERGLAVDFTGDGEPAATAAAFLAAAAGQRVLFPRAAHSRRSVQERLAGRLTDIDLVVYDNEPLTDLQLPAADIWVFTSPLNARAFFAEKKWEPRWQAVAIGRTTAEALRSLGLASVVVAEAPSEDGMAEAVLGVV